MEEFIRMLKHDFSSKTFLKNLFYNENWWENYSLQPTRTIRKTIWKNIGDYFLVVDMKQFRSECMTAIVQPKKVRKTKNNPESKIPFVNPGQLFAYWEKNFVTTGIPLGNFYIGTGRARYSFPKEFGAFLNIICRVCQNHDMLDCLRNFFTFEPAVGQVVT